MKLLPGAWSHSSHGDRWFHAPGKSRSWKQSWYGRFGVPWVTQTLGKPSIMHETLAWRRESCITWWYMISIFRFRDSEGGAGYEQPREGIFWEKKFQHEKFLYWPGHARSVEKSKFPFFVSEIAVVCLLRTGVPTLAVIVCLFVKVRCTNCGGYCLFVCLFVC